MDLGAAFTPVRWWQLCQRTAESWEGCRERGLVRGLQGHREGGLKGTLPQTPSTRWGALGMGSLQGRWLAGWGCLAPAVGQVDNMAVVLTGRSQPGPGAPWPEETGEGPSVLGFAASSFFQPSVTFLLNQSLGTDRLLARC